MTPTTLEIVVVSGFTVAFTTLFVAGYLRQQNQAAQEAYIMNWGSLVKQILPIALSLVPGLPPAVATSIVGTVIAVESLPGKTGAQKKAIVMDAAITQLQNVNVVKGHDVINVDVVAQAVDKGIDAGIAATNAIHTAKVESPAPQATGDGGPSAPQV